VSVVPIVDSAEPKTRTRVRQKSSDLKSRGVRLAPRNLFSDAIAARVGTAPPHLSSILQKEPKAMTAQEKSSDKTAIRPFRVEVPEAELTEMRRRINATKWPEKETVADASQGVQLATMQKLARYWATEYDWRKCEAKLNALPNFITEIDGLDIHFIHVRSKHENALPLIVTHGWPGSPSSSSRSSIR
jgi:hypothetical protein